MPNEKPSQQPLNAGRHKDDGPTFTQSLSHSPAEDGWLLHQDMEVVFAAHLAVSVVYRAFKAAGSFPGHLQHTI